MRRILRYALLLITLSAFGHAGSLSESDRQLLLERLDAIKDATDGRTDARVKIAIKAFRAAMASEEAALELYIKCIEKLNFEDQNRSSQDFREWKRKQKEKLKENSLKLALRYQLHWLTLTLELSLEPEKFNEMSPKAIAALDSIFSNAEHLAGQESMLRQSVTGSVFARAYEVSNVKTGEWPTQPLALDEIYNKIILPPLRRPDKIEQLRSAWLKRIQQEGVVREAWSNGDGNGGPRGRGSRDERPVSYERFLIDDRPDMVWRMEEDLFKAGDEQGAALRMIGQLERYINHPKAAQWIKRFIDLISPPPPEEGPAGETATTKPAP